MSAPLFRNNKELSNMNYWHMQLHPNDRDNFSIDVVKELLKKKEVIGLGQWENGEAKRDQFFKQMMIGDIVAVKQGGTPIALVRVIGDAYVENSINEDLDWFPNRITAYMDIYGHPNYFKSFFK